MEGLSVMLAQVKRKRQAANAQRRAKALAVRPLVDR
jgi:hypothetical protein